MYRFLLLAAACAVTACSGAPKGPEREVSFDQSALLLRTAREKQEKEGCAAAAPSLRVAAAMGESKEAAQHELGECLMTMTGVSDLETRLFREEGFFWLTRAAYAGNARAQRFLAVHYGAGDRSADDHQQALGWALVYAKNSDSDLYGYKALPDTFVAFLQSSLPADKAAAANQFAASFTRLHLAPFEAPKIEGRGPRAGGPAAGGPPEGRRRRRPQ